MSGSESSLGFKMELESQTTWFGDGLEEDFHDIFGRSCVGFPELPQENQNFLRERVVHHIFVQRIFDFVVQDFEHFRFDFYDLSILAGQLHLVSNVGSLPVRLLHDVGKEQHDATVNDVLYDLIRHEVDVLLALLDRLLEFNSVGFFLDLHLDDFSLLLVGKQLAKLVEDSLVLASLELLFELQLLGDDRHQFGNVAAE